MRSPGDWAQSDCGSATNRYHNRQAWPRVSHSDARKSKLPVSLGIVAMD